jgi:hypothetical protein
MPQIEFRENKVLKLVNVLSKKQIKNAKFVEFYKRSN